MILDSRSPSQDSMLGDVWLETSCHTQQWLPPQGIYYLLNKKFWRSVILRTVRGLFWPWVNLRFSCCIFHLWPCLCHLKRLRRVPLAIYLLCTTCLQVGRSRGLGEGICLEALPHLPPHLVREKPFLISSSRISLARTDHVIFHVKYQQAKTAKMDGNSSAWASQIAMKTGQGGQAGG